MRDITHQEERKWRRIGRARGYPPLIGVLDHQVEPGVVKRRGMTRAALYLRVSTGEQSVDNQRRELLETAAQRGWQIVGEFTMRGSAEQRAVTSGPASTGSSRW